MSEVVGGIAVVVTVAGGIGLVIAWLAVRALMRRDRTSALIDAISASACWAVMILTVREILEIST